MITQNTLFREVENWTDYLKSAISTPEALLDYLELPQERFQESFAARALFPLRVPLPFAKKMQKKCENDPLFLQVMTNSDEFLQFPDFSNDPLEEQNEQANKVPSLLHKYRNRVLLMVKGGCAINCRYCFRRHFPYQENKGNKQNWQLALNYIAQHSEIDEVIFSGGDPLMAKDDEIAWLVQHIEQIPHIQRLRIHSRLPVVIPQRITTTLCEILKQSRLQTVLVTHINHANEIDELFCHYIQRLSRVGVTLLNQSVLLKKVNDDAYVLKQLGERLFQAGILPYYLHLFDKVAGASHFFIETEQALAIYRQLQSLTSGYLVPKLAKEIAGEANKVLYG